MHDYAYHSGSGVSVRGSLQAHDIAMRNAQSVNLRVLTNVSFALATIGQCVVLSLITTLVFYRPPEKRSLALVNLLLITVLSTVPPYLL